MLKLSDIRTGIPQRYVCNNPHCGRIAYPKSVFIMNDGSEYCSRQCLLDCEQHILDDDSENDES